MSFNQSKTSTKSKSQTDPWAPAQEGLKFSLSEAKDLYNTPIQYYQGQQIATPSDPLQQSWDLTQQRALSGSPLMDTASNFSANTLGQNYLYSDPSMAGFGELGYDNTYGASPALQYLQNVASGGEIGGNPALADAINQAQRATTEQFQRTVQPKLDQSASLAGGYNSSGRQNAQNAAYEQLGTGLGDIATKMTYDDYARSLAARDEATKQLQGAYQSALGTQLSGLSGLTGAYGDQAQRQVQTLPYLQQLANQDYTDLAALHSVGAEQTAQTQAEIEAEKQKWNFEQLEPWQRLSMYSQYPVSVGGMGGTSSGTTTGTSTPSMMQNIQGLAGSVAAGAAMMSSRDVKENVADAPKGVALEAIRAIPVKNWNYKGDETPHTGPIAEDFNRVVNGEERPMIEHVDMFGALLSAVQELADKVDGSKASKPAKVKVKVKEVA